MVLDFRVTRTRKSHTHTRFGLLCLCCRVEGKGCGEATLEPRQADAAVQWGLASNGWGCVCAPNSRPQHRRRRAYLTSLTRSSRPRFAACGLGVPLAVLVSKAFEMSLLNSIFQLIIIIILVLVTISSIFDWRSYSFLVVSLFNLSTIFHFFIFSAN